MHPQQYNTPNHRTIAPWHRALSGAAVAAACEERRDAGLKHEVTDWLTLSGLLELETGSQRNELDSSTAHSHDDDFDKSLQVGALVAPLSWLKVELTCEYDDEENEHVLDEAFASVEIADLEPELGKLYVPFGVYYSNFASGPVLEFGETRGCSARPPLRRQ